VVDVRPRAGDPGGEDARPALTEILRVARLSYSAWADPPALVSPT
jgi:hypothetical protein